MVGVFDFIIVNVIMQVVICNGDDDGSFSLDIMGGIVLYDVFWVEIGEIIIIISNFVVGMYNVIIMDVNDCVYL